MPSRNALTAFSASRRVSPLFEATVSTNSCLVTKGVLLSGFAGSRGAGTLATRRLPLNHAVSGCILSRGQDVRRGEQRPQPDGVPRQLVHAPLFAVDDADRGAADQARLAYGLYSRNRCTARGYDVLDEAHGLPRLEHALEPIVRPVALRLLADDQEREARFEGRGRDERDGAQFWAREPDGLRLVLAHFARDPLAERAQQLGSRLEAVLVEVVRRAPAAAEDEVALEV